MEELKNIVFEMDSDIAPGPNGFSGIFYKNYWNVIAPNLLAVVYQFFRNGWLPPSINSTIIFLTPKKVNPMHFSIFRPITLYNFLMTIFFGILTKRMGLFSPKSFGLNKVPSINGEKLVTILI